jgi:cytochrome c oxidase subunit II
MRPPRRRILLAAPGLAFASGAMLGLTSAARAQPSLKVAVTASKFKFTPEQIRVRRGETLTLVLTSVDFAHGFAIPELGLRRDLIPGQEVELVCTPVNAGRLHLICDNFCGEGHDDMSGWLIVE